MKQVEESNKNLKSRITEMLVKSMQNLDIPDVIPQVTHPENPEHGEYSTNVCLVLAGKLHQKPMEIAKKLGEAIRQYQKESKIELIERVEIASPGFLNLYVSEANLISQVNGLLAEIRLSYTDSEHQSIAEMKGAKNNHAKRIKTNNTLASKMNTQSKSSPKGRRGKVSEIGDLDRNNDQKRIVVEFTDPNPFKEFHIGHLYSNAVGESFSRLLEANGHIVRRVNYYGDVGMHVAKSIWGLEKKLTEEKLEFSDLNKKSLRERVQFLGAAYAKGATAYEDKNNQNVKEEMKDINYLVFIAAQRILKKTKNFEPRVNYEQFVHVDESKMQRVTELYEKGRQWSLEYFETIYKRLGTVFEGYYPESLVGELGTEIVNTHLNTVFERSDGAIVYKGEKDGLHTRVFINKLGLPTYEAKELGLSPTKYADWPYDRSLIVTGKEIDEYFKVLLAAIDKIRPDLAKITSHIGHGMVRLPSGKMSSRTGKVLTGENLIDEVKARITSILDKNDTKYDKNEKDEIAEKAAIAAIKYSFLKVGIPSDITFDIETSVNFQGDSGPYLQYTYARCKSVLRKNIQTKDTIQDNYSKYVYDVVIKHLNISDYEMNLLRNLVYYPEVVQDAADRLTPNTLCTYLFSVASAFNSLYAHEEILKSKLRLTLTAATAKVLHDGLYLLGINTLERM